MGTDKRERQKANRAARLEEEQAAAAKAKRRQQIRTVIITGVVLVVAMVIISALSGCASEPGSDGASSVDYGTGECPPTDGVDEPVLTFDDAPQQCIDLDKTYTATFETNMGDVTAELDTERTPVTTNNFVTLARYGFYDNTDIHRVVSSVGFVQGGSPQTQNSGDPGPGYTIPDEGGPYTADDYTPGILAMARTAEPNSAGGQFFFLSDEAGTEALASAGTYAVFGHTTEGLDILEQMAALETPGTETPSEQIIVEKVTITES